MLERRLSRRKLLRLGSLSIAAAVIGSVVGQKIGELKYSSPQEIKLIDPNLKEFLDLAGNYLNIQTDKDFWEGFLDFAKKQTIVI